MSFFNSIFGGNSSAGGPDFWIPLTSTAQLDEAVQRSSGRKVVIFKHSTRCHISKMVLRGFESEVAGTDKPVDFYFLDLLNYRNISNEIESRFGVTHQSPQLLVLQNGKVTRHASHNSISASMI